MIDSRVSVRSARERSPVGDAEATDASPRTPAQLPLAAGGTDVVRAPAVVGVAVAEPMFGLTQSIKLSNY